MSPPYRNSGPEVTSSDVQHTFVEVLHDKFNIIDIYKYEQ